MADEYINRKYALFPSLDLCVRCEAARRNTRNCNTCVINDITQEIRDIPAADVAPVVRCKDCKHIQHDALFGQDWCNGRRVTLDWYCADGERKEQDNG